MKIYKLFDSKAMSGFGRKSLIVLFFSGICSLSSFAFSVDFQYSITGSYYCVPLNVVFHNVSSDTTNYSYVWNLDDGMNSKKKDNVSVLYGSGSRKKITLTAYDSKGNPVDSITQYITVHAKPVVDPIVSPDSTCTNETIHYSFKQTAGDTTALTSWLWDFGDGNVINSSTPDATHSYNVPGTYCAKVYVSDYYGCQSTTQASTSACIVVSAGAFKPVVAFTPSASTSCNATLPVTFTNQSTAPNGTISKFIWEFGDGSPSTTVTSVASTSHTFTRTSDKDVNAVTLVAYSNNGCSDSLTKDISLYHLAPQIEISDSAKSDMTADKIACPGNLTFVATGAITDATSFAWSLTSGGSGNTQIYSTSVQNTGSNALNDVVSLQVTDAAGCDTTVTRSFKVEPQLGFISMSPLNNYICGKQVTQSFTPLDINVPVKEIDWTIGSDTVKTYSQTSPMTYTFNASSTPYNINLTITTIDQCLYRHNFPSAFTVFYPSINYTSNPNPIKGCVPLQVTLTNTSIYNPPSTGSGDSIAKVWWDYGDGTALTNQNTITNVTTHTYTTDGTFYGVLHIADKQNSKGCSDITDTFKVTPGSQPTPIYSFPNTICGGQGLTYLDQSTPLGKVDSVSVTFTRDGGVGSASNIGYGNGSIQINFDSKGILNQPGKYNLKTVVGYHGCTDSTSVSDALQVNGPLIKLEPVVINCKQPKTITFTGDGLLSTATSWTWEITNSTTGFVKDTVNSAIGDTTLTYDFSKLGNGHYSIKLTAVNGGCSDIATANFIVNQISPDIALTDTTPCRYIADHLTYGTMDSTYLSQVKWKTISAKGKIRSGLTHNLIFDSIGVYSLRAYITDNNGCTDSITKQYRVYAPVAHFTSKTGNSCLPMEVIFTDSSQSVMPIVSRHWITGGVKGSYTGNLLKVTDKYPLRQPYKVSMIATDSLGCSDTAFLSKPILPLVPASNFTIDNKKLCVGTDAIFRINASDTTFSNNLDSVTWNFGDGTDTTVRKTSLFSISHAYKTNFIHKTVTLTAYMTSPSPEDSVCKNTTTNNSLDVENAKASFGSVTITNKCVIDLVTIALNKNGSFDSIRWYDIYNGTQYYKGDEYISTFSLEGSGPHILTMKGYSSYLGCGFSEDDTTINIPLSSYKIVADKKSVCVNNEIHLSLQDTSNISKYPFIWFFGDGYTNTGSTEITHAFNTFSKKDSSYVSFELNSPLIEPGCGSNTDSIYVQHIKADFTRGIKDADTLGCAPYTVNLYDVSAGENTYSWTFSDGTTDAAHNPTHTFKQTGTATLSITGSLCNDSETKTVSTFPEPYPHIDSTICENKSFNIVLTPDSGTKIVSWQDNPTIITKPVAPDYLTATVKPDTSTYYPITFSVAGHQCIDSLLVKVMQKPYYNGAGAVNHDEHNIPKSNNSLIYLPDSTVVINTANNSLNNLLYGYTSYKVNNKTLSGIIYSWKPSDSLSCSNCANPTIDVSKDETYVLTMTDTMSCFVVTQTISFKMILQTDIGLPTAFTPNKDGTNDLVIPRGWGVKDFIDIKIFNRWGEMVYQSNSMEKGWDGSFNGKPQDPDTYVWIINYKDVNNAEQVKKGYITLLR